MSELHVPPSALHLEQIDAPLVVAFLNHLETTRAQSPEFQKRPSGGHQVVHALPGVS